MDHSWCCDTSGWRADCASVFFSRRSSFVYKRTCSTKQTKEQFQSSVGRLLNLGACQEAVETRPRSLAVFDFSTSGQDTQGQLKHFSAQFCWYFGSALLRALSYKKDPGRLCMLSSLLWTLHLFPKAE